MQSADVAFTAFINSFNQLYDKYFTIITKKITKKTLLKPWITNEMVDQIKYKHALARLYNKGRIDKKSYTNFKNRLTKVLREAKIEYFANEFSKKEGDIKGTWQVINKSIKNRTKNKNIVVKENEYIVNKKYLPNKFIKYFISVPYSLVSKVRSVDIDILHFLSNRPRNTFFFSPIINKDIESVIKNLKNNNGIHNISTIVLKEIMLEISEPLSFIFNLCISQGYFPIELKSGCITPTYKKGEHSNIENYRPVCSLSQFSKIFEKVIYHQMINYIEKNKIITNSQFGFRANKSTESALIDLVDFVHKGLTNKSNIGAVFMDLSKAFDVMSHDILKIKLEHYGFRGSFLDFLMSFLKDRKYFVSVNGYISDMKKSNIGVPQGSTLGPLLFLIYINDIVNCSNILKFILFADDTTVLFENSNINDLNNVLSQEIDKVMKWFSANKLLINLSKTNTMLFSNKRGNPKLHVCIEDTLLEEKQNVTFLGVIIDNKLQWRDHIKLVCSKISKSIGILCYLRHAYPIHILRLLYMSLIFSYLNYCNVVWGSAYECHLRPLLTLQKKAVRIITKSAYDERSAPIFNSLKILQVPKIHKLNCFIFMFKCLNCNNFPIFRNKILQNTASHNYATRHRDLFYIPRERLEICRKSFLNKGISLWNELDSEVKNLKTLKSFKKVIKNILLQN